MKRKNVETINKYAAGLFDADGCLSFYFPNGNDKPSCLMLRIGQSSATPKACAVIEELYQHYRLGHLQWHPQKGGSDVLSWTITASGEVETMLNQLTKHMLIKGGHWRRMLYVFKNRRTTDSRVLKRWSRWSRSKAGPVKPKNFIGPAYIAGFLDGDGCFYTPTRFRKNRQGELVASYEPSCQVSGHKNDIIVAQYLQRALGGHIRFPWRDRPHLFQYSCSLGAKMRGTVFTNFVPLVKHLRIKRWKLEQIISFHNQQQRLNPTCSTEQVTV